MIRRSLERAVLSREQAAKRELDRVVEAEKILYSKLAEIERASTAVDVGAVLDDPTNLDAIGAHTTRLRSAADAAHAALDGLRGRRRQALEALFAARADTLRQQADALIDQAQAIEDKTNKLFAEIAAAEGLSSLSFADIVLPNEPRSAALRREADDVLNRAAKCRIPAASIVDLQPASLPALIDQVVGHESVTPSIGEVTSWFETALRRLKREAPRYDAQTLRVRLFWNADGQIVHDYPNQSTLQALLRVSGAAHLITVTGSRS